MSNTNIYVSTYIRTYVSNVYIEGNDGVHDLIHYYICKQKEKLHSTCMYIRTHLYAYVLHMKKCMYLRTVDKFY